MASKIEPLDRARTAKRESKYVEFKERFDPQSPEEWIELVKDFAALANSGGGLIVIGLRNNGDPSGEDVQPVLDLDPAALTDKLFKYSGINHSGFSVQEAKRGKKTVAVISVDPTDIPVTFTHPGTYLDPSSGKQKNAFSQGTVYFRHGAKSEPGTSDDLRRFIEMRVEAIRKAWLRNIRRVVTAPRDAQIAIFRSAAAESSETPAHIQLTMDPEAPVYGKLDPDQSHPYRQKELVKRVNERFSGRTAINMRDVQCVRRVHDINPDKAPQFCHKPRFATMQYSEAFVEWLIEQYKKDPEFFLKARSRYREMR